MKVRVLFQDEGRFGRISDRRRCWGPLPKRPIVGSQVIREYIYSLTAVCPENGQISSLIMPTVDTEIMSIFLSHTANVFEGDFCLMFLDRAGWHRSNELRVPKSMRLLPLPPYSPELNPVEGVWEYLRENYFGNRPLKSLDEVEDRLCQAIRSLIQSPELVRSITNYPWFNTICLTAN